jgi:hypothetical protein
MVILMTFLVLGLAGECEKPPPSKEKTEATPCPSDRVPKDKPNIQGKRYVVIYGCAEESMGPLDLSIFVRDTVTGETGSHHEISAGGEIQYVIGYDQGHRTELTVEFKPVNKGSKKGFLYISDGPGNRKFYFISGGWRAQTDPIFTTAR